MNYKVKCTHCIHLLKNCRTFENAKFETEGNEVYVDVEGYTLAQYVYDLNAHQERSYKIYQSIMNWN